MYLKKKHIFLSFSAILLFATTQPINVFSSNEIQINVPSSENNCEVIRQSNGLFSTNLLKVSKNIQCFFITVNT